MRIWAVTVGRNLTDEFVISNNIITAPLYGSIRVGSLLPPRTYGLTLAYNF
jgi:iron complex outermembrane receptor protein